MGEVIEVLPAEWNTSTSNNYNEWLGSLGEDVSTLKLIRGKKTVFLTDILAKIFDVPIGNQIINIDETTKSEIYISDKDVAEYELFSPLMPPKRRIKIKAKIKNIKRGKPSICDEILEL
jgi:hypothetical protein